MWRHFNDKMSKKITSLEKMSKLMCNTKVSYICNSMLLYIGNFIIKRYGTCTMQYLLCTCRDGAGSKWSTVLKVREQLCDNHSRVRQRQTKSLCYNNCTCTIEKCPQKFRSLTKAQKNCENYDFVFILFPFLFPHEYLIATITRVKSFFVKKHLYVGMELKKYRNMVEIIEHKRRLT